MEIIKGIQLNSGLAFAKIRTINKFNREILIKEAANIEEELQRIDDAILLAENHITDLIGNLKDKKSHETLILEAQKMLLSDAGLIKNIKNFITNNNVTAEYAVYSVGNTYIENFRNLHDEYIQERALDIKDIISRLIDILLNESLDGYKLNQDSIIIADELTPGETLRLEKDKLKGIVLVNGSYNSHTAILARTYNIPSIIKADIEEYEKYDGMDAVVDGEEGVLYINPDEHIIRKMRRKSKQYDEELRNLLEYKELDDVTADGKTVHVYANTGSIEETEMADEFGASGVGLFRSEFVYLNAEDFPSEDYQFELYKKAAQIMGNKKIIIRTLDIGGDKTAQYFELEKEANPALGNRAIRYSLANREVFISQLRAIYRAAAFGNIAIMLPMITAIFEIDETKEIIREIKSEFDKKGICYGEVSLGIMIETPGAALISDDLAKEVDFFSIGTNDLIQYTLAADRQNPVTDKYFDTRHPAILKQIELIIKNAHRENIEVSICGEMATDEDLVPQLIEMGIDGLSVPPSKILSIRKRVRESFRRK